MGQKERPKRNHFRLAVIVETENTSGRSVLRGIGRYACEKRNFRIHYIRPDSTGSREWVEELKHWDRGAVIARVDHPAIAETLREIGLPVIDVSNEHDTGFHAVGLNNEAIGVVAADHLIELGFRRLAFLGVTGSRWVEGRLQGVRRATLAAGITPIVEICPGWPVAPWEDSPMRRRVRHWLENLPKPIGIVACSDIWADCVLQEAARAGIVIPEDVAVVGVDNDDLICECTTPTMSSVMAHHFRVGYEAAVLATRLVEGSTGIPKLVSVDPKGVAARGSTDVFAVDDSHVSAAVQFIRQHACEGIQVEDVVAKVPVSRSVLQRKFQATLGRSIHDHIVDARVKRAKELLANTDLPIPIVAERAGITPQPYLNVVFKARVGESPARYRKQMQHAYDSERSA